MSDRVKRELAFELYVQSGGVGKKRSVEGLWKSWVEKVRDNPESRVDIPTLNREQIYKWSREDNWVERAAQRDEGVTEFIRETYEKAKERGYSALSVSIVSAVETLAEASQEAPWRERIAAANSILDRVGIVPQTKTKDLKGPLNVNPKAPPPIDADEETLIAWMQETQGGQNNG